MGKISDILYAQKRLWQQRREIAQLHKELQTLRAQNNSMREGMRRCVTCEYRIDYKRRQGEPARSAPTATAAADATDTDNNTPA
ncbi:MAG: hypothetical protein KDI17_08465 [Halioglobus sp.]|nr:hypothetical protein [Halioglobus sp.]